MRRSLALGGFGGTGKSTVGRALAARTALPLVDLDAELAARWGPITRQFAADGEAEFRARETALLREVVAGPVGVVATGGGTWVSAENRAILRACRRVVLTAPPDELRRRVGAVDLSRPLWDDALESRLAARAEAYADADLHVDTSGREPAALADAIAAWWAEADSSSADGYQSPAEGE